MLFRNRVGFKTLFRRESLRFLRLKNQTLVPFTVTTLLYIIVFGFFLGPNVSHIEGFSYIHYIFPGLLMMGVVMASFQNTSSSLFHARWDHFIHDLLVAPISYFEMVLAYVSASMLRGLLVAFLGLIVCIPIAGVPFKHPFLCVLSLLISTLIFGSAGLIAGLWAERWDNISVVQNYVITPLTFLGGVFYSASTIPEHLQWILYINPLFYIVSSVRYSFLGTADISFTLATTVNVFLGVGFFSIAVVLFKRGYKLRV